MLVDDLPAEVKASFMEGYELPGDPTRDMLFGNAAETAAQHATVPEAYLDAVRLRIAMYWVYTADTTSEYKRDVAEYDALARKLNAKYGDIVVLSDESATLGLRGHRRTAYSRLTKGVRNPDGSETVTVVDLAAEVEREDEAVRAQEKSRRSVDLTDGVDISEIPTLFDDEPARDRTAELADVLGMSTLEFAELFGAGWTENDAPLRHDWDSDPSGGPGPEQTPWMIAGDPAQLMIRVFHHGVFLAEPEGSWKDVGRLEYQPTGQQYLRSSDFASEGPEVVADLLNKRRRRFRYCAFCRRPTPPERRFSGDTCMGCAEGWLGVRY